VTAEPHAPEPQKQIAESPPANVPPAKTAQEELAEAVTGAGFTFDVLQRWGIESGNLVQAGSWAGFDDVPVKDARRILRAKDAMIDDLAKYQEVAS
jgi:hypothetical protein